MAEVAGVVLGGIPLLISAVEHYEECFRMLGCMRDFKHEYKKCRNRVKLLDLRYDDILDQLFLDVVDSRDELDRLKACPDDNGWKEIEARLKERLRPKVHQPYLDTMRDMQDTIQDLAEELGVDKIAFQECMLRKGSVTVPAADGIGSNQLWSDRMNSIVRSSKERLSYEAQRLKFSQGKRRRDQLFEDVERYMGALEGLKTRNDERAKMTKSSQRPWLTHRPLLEFWRHARNVYTLLSLSWKCPCRAEHCADLRLMHRDVADVVFEISFRSNVSSAQQSGSPWASHHVIVKESQILQQAAAPRATQIPTPAPKSRASPLLIGNRKIGLPVTSLKKPANSGDVAIKAASKSQTSVAFASNPASSSSAGKAAVTVMPRGQSPMSGQTSKQMLTRIENLCQAIGTHKDSQPCVGLLTDGGIHTEYSLLSVPNTGGPPVNTESTTLTHLLSDTSKDFTRAKRYSIALTVASSHLQLHSSFWLGHEWSSGNIYFSVINGSADFEQLYLRAGFNDKPATSGRISTIDETFVTLGIILLELCFQKTFENSPFRARYRSPDGQRDSWMDLAAASRWAEKVEEEAGPEYADAVSWCLGKRRVRHNDNTWRHDLLQNVIEPLASTHQKLISIST
ncbi:unnamed protein product [Cercospora beticola]|nr:unnamed protein product [Cercospora beticola]